MWRDTLSNCQGLVTGFQIVGTHGVSEILHSTLAFRALVHESVVGNLTENAEVGEMQSGAACHRDRTASCGDSEPKIIHCLEWLLTDLTERLARRIIAPHVDHLTGVATCVAGLTTFQRMEATLGALWIFAHGRV